MYIGWIGKHTGNVPEELSITWRVNRHNKFDSSFVLIQYAFFLNAAHWFLVVCGPLCVRCALLLTFCSWIQGTADRTAQSSTVGYVFVWWISTYSRLFSGSAKYRSENARINHPAVKNHEQGFPSNNSCITSMRLLRNRYSVGIQWLVLWRASTSTFNVRKQLE